MSFPGDSRQRFIWTVCCRTTVSASSRRRPWSSMTTGGGDVVILADTKWTRGLGRRGQVALKLRYRYEHHQEAWAKVALAPTNQSGTADGGTSSFLLCSSDVGICLIELLSQWFLMIMRAFRHGSVDLASSIVSIWWYATDHALEAHDPPSLGT